MDGKLEKYSLEKELKIYDNGTGDCITVCEGEEGFGVKMFGGKYANINCVLDKELAVLFAEAILEIAKGLREV